MRLVLLTLVVITAILMSAGAQTPVGDETSFDIRARESLLFGSGASTGREYYDVPITRQPDEGVLIKLPYTQKGGKLTFDLHHRIGLSEDFGLPAEVMTVVEAITGGTNRIGTYTLLNVIEEDDRFAEEIDRASDADIDRYVTPMTTRTVTIDTRPGPQSISIVGRDLTITRSGLTTRIDTPGTRIAMVSNIRFEEARPGTPLEFSDARED